MCAGVAPVGWCSCYRNPRAFASLSKVPFSSNVYQILLVKGYLTLLSSADSRRGSDGPCSAGARETPVPPASPEIISQQYLTNALVCTEACTGREQNLLIPHTNGDGPQQSTILGPEYVWREDAALRTCVGRGRTHKDRGSVIKS